GVKEKLLAVLRKACPVIEKLAKKCHGTVATLKKACSLIH
uniref:U1-ectatotoxin-Et1b subunit A n=1 Tax=Ectatomma tuberculatum TaxID=39300 RepID=TX1BA_ECTTU|nr:RecName: Full=U1-ectatotoxin-Et1b subunit A; Short=U1-ECTX-Et1b subunit A; AltName: Full=Ectatomin-Et2 subunit A [Ectatomma tuberculatum]